MWPWPLNGALGWPEMSFVETRDYRSDGVRKERTGWRDARLSERHRDWGFNCPAADLDFLMAEYNKGLPVGLVEYKHHFRSFPKNFDHPTYRALSALCNDHGAWKNGEFVQDPLPFLIARYWPEIWGFCVVPVNDMASSFFWKEEYLSEYDFVRRLYLLRRLTLTKAIQGNLNTILPTE